MAENFPRGSQKLAREMRFQPWPLLQSVDEILERRRSNASIGTRHHPDGSVNFGYLDIGRWWEAAPGNCLGRGWVRDSRFGSGDVIPGGKRKARP